MMEDLQGADICRVCRSEGVADRPLFHPCICTGSIKWIHQECLVQWMRYSRKEYCELCGHRFSFTPIYSPDMPRRLPLRDVAGGLLSSVATAVKYWLHYTLVALAWLGIVPLTACRIYRCLFTGSVDSVLTLPLDMLSTDNIASDVFHGCFVVTCTLFAFIGLVWLREQILHGGGPDWLERDNHNNPLPGAEGQPPPNPPPPPENNNVLEQDLQVLEAPPIAHHELEEVMEGAPDPAGALDPSAGAPGPGAGAPGPGAGTPDPAAEASDTGEGAPDPGAGSTDPGAGAAYLGTGTTYHGTGTTYSGTRATNPGAGAAYHGAGAAYHGAGAAFPGTGVANPGAVAAFRGGGAAYPGAGAANPGAGVAIPGTGAANPGAGVAIPGTGAANPGSGAAFPVAGVANPGTGAVYHGARVAYPGSGAVYPGSGVTNPGGGAANPGAGAANPSSGAAYRSAGAAYRGAGAASSGVGTANPGAGITYPGAGVANSAAGATNPGAAVAADVGTGAAYPGAGAAYLGAGAANPAAEVANPAAEAINPAAGAVHPGEAAVAAEPAAAAADPGAGIADEGDAAGADEGNWNPIEWDRAAEELTWERLLGLDGSLVFLEHVFWVVSLNTLFILVFAFCPYHIGHFAVVGFSLREHAAASHFEGLVTTLCGYCVIGLCLVLLHALASLLGLRRSRRVLGLCYVVVKVSLLSVVEIGVLPLICGWWLDICSLSMFDATLRDRESSFRLAPGTSMFIHWLVGMVYVYYFASFILLLREVLRPGVLWFLRNLNDPDFSPIQEMIHLPIVRHIRRLLASAVIFGTAVLLMLWLPVRILRAAWPSFLPYTVALQSEAQVNELSLELLLLQVILPALLEQSHTRTWLKGLVRAWCRAAAWVLDLRSYLLGEEQPEPERGARVEPPAHGLGAAHQALLQREGPTGFQPYERPQWFPARLAGLLAAVCATLVLASLAALTLPVWLGRRVMALWLVGAPPPSPPVLAPERAGRVHELYTAACGTYLCWLAARAAALLLGWLPQGRAAVAARLRQWCILGAKSAVAFSVLLGLVPLLFGLLLELVVVVPLRVPLDQTPVLFVWQDWALGVLYTKIACAVTMMGPEWALRRSIERAYRDGIRGMDLAFVLRELAAPVVACFGLALAVPYAAAHGIVPLLVTSPHLRILIARRLYPFLLLVTLVGGVVVFQVRQFRKLYEHIKNDKYLVGRRLVNYDHRRHKSPATQTSVSH